MTQTTGFGKGRPSKFDLTITDNPLKTFLALDKSLDVAIADAIRSADWLGAEDEGSALLAIHLAKQLVMQENRTHQIAPVLISLLGSLGLIYGNRQQDKTDLVDDFLSELRSNEVASN